MTKKRKKMSAKRRVAMRKFLAAGHSPQARAKALATRARNRAAKLKQLPQPLPATGENHASTEDLLAVYAFGHVEAWLEIVCKGRGVPFAAVAYRLGEALSRAGRRQVVGPDGGVPGMR